MPCMAPLPDGTFMILNGAHQGVAGFGLASSPNLNALLYDPAKPVNQRISILGNTIVARLYHSEVGFPGILSTRLIFFREGDPSAGRACPCVWL